MNGDYLEREGDEPEGWVTNVVMRKGADGKMEIVEVPDDTEEVMKDAVDDSN